MSSSSCLNALGFLDRLGEQAASDGLHERFVAIRGLQVTEPESSSCRRRPAGDEFLGRTIRNAQGAGDVVGRASGSTVTNACRVRPSWSARADGAVAPRDRDEIGPLQRPLPTRLSTE